MKTLTDQRACVDHDDVQGGVGTAFTVYDLRNAAEHTGLVYSGHIRRTPRIDRLVAAARRLLLTKRSVNRQARLTKIRAWARLREAVDHYVNWTLVVWVGPTSFEEDSWDKSDTATLLSNEVFFTASPRNPLRNGRIITGYSFYLPVTRTKKTAP